MFDPVWLTQMKEGNKTIAATFQGEVFLRYGISEAEKHGYKIVQQSQSQNFFGFVSITVIFEKQDGEIKTCKT